MKKINRRVLIIIGVILFSISLVFFIVDLLATSNWSPIRSIRLRFTPVRIKRGTIRAQILFPGTIDFREHTILEFQQVPANGVLISWIGAKVGDYVKKGQLLATLDLQSVLKQQQLNLSNFLNQRYTFDQAISDNGGRTDPNMALNDTQKRALLQNQIALNNSVYNVELQDIVSRLSNLYTPINGLVTKIDIPYAGVNIQSADQEKFEVINPTTMFFNADVDETEVSNLHVGDKGIVILNAFPTEYDQVTISDIAFAPHQDTNNNNVYTIKLNLDNKDDSNYKYKFGMSGYIVFYEYNSNILFVPNDYLHTDENGTFVRVGSGQKSTYIQTGISDGKVTEIVKGVNEGDVIYY